MVPYKRERVSLHFVKSLLGELIKDKLIPSVAVGKDAVPVVNAIVEPATAVQWRQRLPTTNPLEVAFGIFENDAVVVLDILAGLLPRDPQPHYMCATGGQVEHAVCSSTLT